MGYLITFCLGGVCVLFGGAFVFNLLTFIDSWEDFFGLIGLKRLEQHFAEKRLAAHLEYEKRFAPKHKRCDACGKLPEIYEDRGYVWRGEDFAICESCFEIWLWERDAAEDAGLPTTPMGAWAEAQRNAAE